VREGKGRQEGRLRKGERKKEDLTRGEPCLHVGECRVCAHAEALVTKMVDGEGSEVKEGRVVKEVKKGRKEGRVVEEVREDEERKEGRVRKEGRKGGGGSEGRRRKEGRKEE
jgi:hypothetical protein